ncbi:MAG: hypothetical protein N3A38_16395, partial [Planctomycetota bacterium]|nr:hypothetical protein [Planctomycetota bacterium]
AKCIISEWRPVNLREGDFHNSKIFFKDGETVELKWDNEGFFIPYGKQGPKLSVPKGYEYRPGRDDGVYAAIGQETQSLKVNLAPEGYDIALFPGSVNTACSPLEGGGNILHPARKGEPAYFVYRMPSPFVAVDAEIEATLIKDGEADVCALSLSLDRGKTWKRLYTKEKQGREKIRLNIGRLAREGGRPSVYSHYEFLVRAEFTAAGNVLGAGMSDFAITAYRQCNKRTLPNLRPGKNVLRVSGEMKKGAIITMNVKYSVSGEPRQKKCLISSLPFYFEINVEPAEEKALDNYDQAFNVGPLRMQAIEFSAAPAGGTGDASLSAGEAEKEFLKPFPHPADMTAPRPVEYPEDDPMESSGFFPQRRTVSKDRRAMEELIGIMKSEKDDIKRWKAAEDLGCHPDSIDFLLEIWPAADGDLKLHLCKALAQIGSPKAVEPLLKTWAEVPKGAPGTRYIPDVLAVIGDRRVVPDLVKPLRRLRFDYRFHIVHALGILGGEEAEKALKDVAENDPFPAVRRYAGERPCPVFR